MIEQPLLGLHHVTALARQPQAVLAVMQDVLGLCLSQQSADYLVFAVDDDTSVSYLCLPHQPPAQYGTNMLAQIAFAVPSVAALRFWQQRLASHGLAVGRLHQQFNTTALDFEDSQQQRYQLVVSASASAAWHPQDIPEAFALCGLGPVLLNVVNVDHALSVLCELLGFERQAQVGGEQLLTVGAGLPHQQLLLAHRPDLPLASQGFGMVHHAAFAVADEAALQAWHARIADWGLAQSPQLAHADYQADYFRVAPQVLLELASMRR